MRSTLLSIVANIFVAGILLGAGSAVWKLSINHWWTLSILVLGGLAVAIQTYALWQVHRQDGDFCCILSEDRIRCECPVASLGTSFDIALTEIIDVEDDEGRCVITTRDGKRLWLTRAFGNPAFEFYEALKRHLQNLAEPNWKPEPRP